MRTFWTTLFLLCASPFTARPEPTLEAFFSQHCIACHGPQKQKGKVRLDLSDEELFASGELAETIIAVLEAEEMPPEDEPQPGDDERAGIIALLEKRILASRPDNPLKRITQEEYKNTILDLFGVKFDFTDLLPPDQAEHGFDKFGESHLMSSHQVVAYLKTARFVAEQILPDAQPETKTWNFDVRHFHGSLNFATGGGGDFRDGDEYVITGFRPYRSNLHFSINPEKHDQFVIPAFGVYRLEVKARSEKSREGEIIGINLGDGRHPTSFRTIRRVAMPHGSTGFTTELTLKAGDKLAFTFDSARVPGRSLAKKPHTGPAMRFSEVKVMGPLVEEWPSAAIKAALPRPDMTPEELVDHIALLLTQRPLAAEDRDAFIEIARSRQTPPRRPRLDPSSSPCSPHPIFFTSPSRPI